MILHHLLLQEVYSIAPLSHQTIVLDILQEAQAWLWAQGINQWTLLFTSEWVQECLAREEFFIATVAHEAVAIVRLVDSDPFIWEDHSNEAIYIHSLAVRRGWQGRGIGNHLLQWVEMYASQNDYQFLRLDCMADNRSLCQYYEQAGFVVHGVKEFPSGDSIYKAQLYEKSLLAAQGV